METLKEKPMEKESIKGKKDFPMYEVAPEVAKKGLAEKEKAKEQPTAYKTEMETLKEKPMEKERIKRKKDFPMHEAGTEAAKKEPAEKRKTKDQMFARKTGQETAVGKGRKYEAQAAAYVEGLGYRIRERNFRCRQGEIDLIAQKEDALFFIEVKGQKKDWQAEQKINAGKKQRILAASVEYLRQEDLWQRCAVHYDVIIITGQEIRYYADAFEW